MALDGVGSHRTVDTVNGTDGGLTADRKPGTHAGRRTVPGYGARLRELRDRASVTQVWLAARIGVAEVTVRRWELGIQVPPSGYLRSLAAALGCTVDAVVP